MAQCPTCGSDVPDGKRFCGDCGAAVDLTSAPTETSLKSEPPAVSHPTPDQARFIPGTVLAKRYRIVGLLGRGGMGEVYRADDLKLGQPVALKFLPQAVQRDQARLERFLNEVKTALKVSHPNVCRVHDIGEVDGQHYLSMEYVDGEDLASLLRRIERLPQNKAVQIARQLCAGLAAAHEQGILHRDLKPANVMIDGRGRAKITDFGLASLAQGVEGEEVRAGTPQYMSPEQHAGKEVTVRSDLYSLGLVLYELFTGKRAFDAASPAEIRRLQEQSSPTSPSSHVEGLDQAVERIILRSLDKEPSQRPSSALAIAAALPGGDPLAAALAAGETPSPEMVAAAGGETVLRPAIAIALLFVIAVGFLLDLLYFGKNDLTRKVPLPKPPDALVVDAQEIARLAGLKEPPADSVHWFSYDFDGQSEQLEFIKERDESRARWDRLATIQPKPIRFFYRQSPELLLSAMGQVNQHDPPRTVPGMLEIQLQPDGSLVELLVIPPDWEETDKSESEAEWTSLFDRAGLALDSFVSTRPVRNPLVACDVRRAWEGTYASQPDLPIRVEAGANRGKPVYFEIIAPWDRPEEEQATEGRLGSRAGTIILVVLLLVLLGVALMLARRNLRLGRGDRRGAFRMAACYFLIQMIGHSLMDHHVANVRQVWYLLLNAALSLLFACIVWAAYVALEPYVRRLWPETLITWSRLLTGRIRDSRIGRDVMIGGVGYTFVVVLSLILRILRRAVDDAPPDLSTYPYLVMLNGWKGTVNTLGQQLLNGFTMTFLVLFFLFVLRWVLRRQWAAVAGFLLLTGVIFALQSDGPAAVRALMVVGGLLYWSASVYVLTRYGFLAFVVMWVLVQFGRFTALVSEFPAWYAESGLLFLVVAAGFVLYSFRISLAGRPLFSDDILGPRESP